jgi:predicted DCC family thiol-disulfide oxidoreductase YuxK
MKQSSGTQTAMKPILLFNGECAVCRSIADWVKASSHLASGQTSIIVQPIGDDPDALRALNPNLDIWDAYETIHILMPNGSLKIGGEAVAQVLRSLPNCRWFAWSFAVSVFGFRPFQSILNIGYEMLADVRPLLGCESCGIPSPWVKFVGSLFKRVHNSARMSPHPMSVRVPLASTRSGSA